MRQRFARHASGTLASILLTLTAITNARAETAVSPTAGAVPRVVLVLSGGGARGAAHIGVLRALEREHVPIAAIVGTSMGAVVGGLYASGYSPDELDRIFRRTDWASFFIDDPDRSYFRFRRKREDSDYLARAAAGVSLDGVKLPSGAVYGQKVMAALTRYTLHVMDIDSFDDLAIPFRAVATDIVTAHPVVLDRGALAEAMYASMAIPALIAPVRVDGKLLVDGGVSNNLPVDVALKLDPDVIVAVDISTPLLSEDAFTSLFAVTDQLTTVLTRANTEQQMKALRPQDILITPPLTGYSSVDFMKGVETIPVAEQVVLDAHDRLKPFAIPDEDYERWRNAARRVPANTIEIVDIDVDSDSAVRESVLEHQAGIRPGTLDLDEIDRAINRLYGTELFSHVSYRVRDNHLTLQPRRKPWGPNYVQVGLNLEDDFQGQNAYNLGLAFTATELNSLGGEWRAEISIGDRPLFANELYQPFGADGRWFVAPSFGYDGFNLPIFDDGHLETEYRIRRFTGGIDVGRELGTTQEYRIGIRSGIGDVDRLVGHPVFESPRADTGFVFTSYAYDDLDNLYFPRGGLRVDLQLTAAERSLGSEERYRAFTLEVLGATSRSEHTIFSSASIAHVVDGEAPLAEKFTLGGFLRLSGLQVDQLLGDHRLLLLGGYRYRWLSSPVLPAYVGASVELGNVWERQNDIDFSDMRLGGSVFIGFDTFLGPVYIAGGIADGGDATAYVYLGRLM
jgi:NTE family protein